jgi:hypothetical protein
LDTFNQGRFYGGQDMPLRDFSMAQINEFEVFLISKLQHRNLVAPRVVV